MFTGQHPTREAVVVVLIETTDDRAIYKTWRRIRNLRAFKAACKEQYAIEYPGCKVSFGAPLWTNHYGAH